MEQDKDVCVMLNAQLGGITDGIHFESRGNAFWAIRHLNSCEEHHGIHHFAVTHEGQTVWVSKTGIECLMKAGII